MAYSSAVSQRRGHQLCTLSDDLTQPPQRALLTETDINRGEPQLKPDPSMTAKPSAVQKAFLLLSNLPKYERVLKFNNSKDSNRKNYSNPDSAFRLPNSSY